MSTFSTETNETTGRKVRLSAKYEFLKRLMKIVIVEVIFRSTRRKESHPVVLLAYMNQLVEDHQFFCRSDLTT